MKPTIDEIKLSEVIFDEVIYPRKDHDPVLVQRYADVLDEIEAQQAFISVASDCKLLDGKHRWLAYRKKYGSDDPKTKVLRYDVSTPHEQLKLAARLNSVHGWQLSEDDKQSTAITLHIYGCTYEDIADTLSVGKKKVQEWLSKTVREEKDRRDKKIFAMWLACHSQQEIADDIRCDQATVQRTANGSMQTVLENRMHKSLAEHASDFAPPIYNVWRQREKTAGSSHFGNSEVRWLDNLLYLYTKPFDVVVDPFAGGGSTVDLCRKRLRRYFVSDRKPIVEREKEIRPHDLTTGLPPLHKQLWKDVRLVYLDPPYWKQAEGQYSDDPTDMANMPLEQFNDTLSSIIRDFARKMTSGYIALLIQPTQWNAPERAFTDHVGDMLCAVKLAAKLPVKMRFSCPYESEQYTPQMVEWAKEQKECLVLTRELIVWRVD
jgi:hypothetical protein